MSLARLAAGRPTGRRRLGGAQPPSARHRPLLPDGHEASVRIPFQSAAISARKPAVPADGSCSVCGSAPGSKRRRGFGLRLGLAGGSGLVVVVVARGVDPAEAWCAEADILHAARAMAPGSRCESGAVAPM